MLCLFTIAIALYGINKVVELELELELLLLHRYVQQIDHYGVCYWGCAVHTVFVVAIAYLSESCYARESFTGRRCVRLSALEIASRAFINRKLITDFRESLIVCDGPHPGSLV